MSKPYHITIRYDGLTGMNTSETRRSRIAQSRTAKRIQKIVRSLVLVEGRPEKPLERVRMVCTRHSSQEPDYLNLVHSFKALIDGLNDFVIVDDSPKHFEGGHPDYRWEPAPRGKGYMTIEIEEVEA